MTKAKTYYSAFALIAACMVIAFGLWHLAGLSRFEGLLTLACLLLGAAQIIAHVGRDRRADRTIAQVEDIALANAQSIRELDAVKQSLAELRQEVARAGQSRNEELVAQFQVLESLVKQLADKIEAQQVRAVPERRGRPSDEPGVRTAGSVSNGRDLEEQPHAAVSDAQMLDTVRKSLEDNRVDLYLQPVVLLPQRKTRYYEALTRLRSGDGEVIMPSSYLQVAENAGIMPMIDNLLLFRCVKVMRRLVERNRDIGVFCNLSAHSLLDPEFFPHFLEFMKQNEELSGSLIFELSQSTVDSAGPLELESMSMLRDLGFQFSMDHVSTLDIDFQALADRGFRFLKVGASTLIDGMANSGAQIHSADLKALLARFGLELIAEKIETERDVVTLLDYEVGLGQGYLFSEPRLVREEIIEAPRPQPASVA